MNIKKFKEAYKFILGKIIVVIKIAWKLFEIIIFIIIIVAMIPFIPLIILGKFICDKIKEKK